MGLTAIIAGASGLTGSSLLNHLINDPSYEKIKIITRRNQNKKSPKVEEILIPDFDKLSDYQDLLEADHAFCCLGTTIKTAGSKPAFKKVDLEYPGLFADYTLANGATTYLLVSSIGADKNSFFFYTKVKGEVEDLITAKGFSSVHIFRPSFLVGDRDENRAGEKVAKFIADNFAFLFFGPFKKYKAIEADKVTRAMAFFAKKSSSGVFIHESGDLQKF